MFLFSNPPRNHTLTTLHQLKTPPYTVMILLAQFYLPAEDAAVHSLGERVASQNRLQNTQVYGQQNEATEGGGWWKRGVGAITVSGLNGTVMMLWAPILLEVRAVVRLTGVVAAIIMVVVAVNTKYSV